MTASIQTKKDKYYIVLSWNESGKRKQKWVGTDLTVSGNNKRKAEQKRKEILQEWETKALLTNYEDILFSDYLKRWLEESKHTFADTTYCIYKNVIEGVISPYFEQRKIKLADLKSYHIQEFYTYKMRNDNISANTIHHYHANIHRALNYAVKTERIKSNPANNIDLPKKQKHIADFYTADELKQLLQVARGTDIEAVVLIATWFGLRRGEIIGLKWNCIDFENRTITVKGTIARAEKTIYKETAKNNASLRTFPLSDEAVKYFLALREKQQQNKKHYGKHYIDKWRDFVCVRDNGDLLKLDYVTRHFPLLCEKCGLRKIRLHELRHSNISLLIANGASMKEVQEWAGHSTYSTTADIYAHIQSQNKIRLTNSIQALLSE